MPRIPSILLALTLIMGAFSYWGIYTTAGRNSFDEMDALYPFFAGILAVLALLLFAAWLMLRRPND